MFSALKRFTNRGDAPETSINNPSHQTMSANLQRKFARGVQYNMKIVIKGDRNVGKTCLFHRLQGKKFIDSYIPTEEIQVASIHWNYKATDDIVKVEVWDVVDKGKKKKTFGGLKLDNSQIEVPQEAALDAEFLDVYKNANGVILVMDITKSWTFNYIQNELPKIPEHIPIMILANHCDMAHHRTVTSHHLTFYVENLQRSPNAAQVRCCESSMRNGFGLKILHKFFNLPFLQLQKDTLLKQLETNRIETDLTINELDIYMESEEADYNKFLERLVQKRRFIADSAKPLDLPSSQSIQNLQHNQRPTYTQPIVNSHSESDLKRSVSFNESYKIGPIGGGHPISLGHHKTAIGVGNPHSKVLGPNFNMSDIISRSAGDCKIEQYTQATARNGPIRGPEPLMVKETVPGVGGTSVSGSSNVGGGFISKFFGKSKEIQPEPIEIKSNVKIESIKTVDEFVPDDGVIDRSFLEDSSTDLVIPSAEMESESDEEFGNPLVSGFQDDLDPDDLISSKTSCNECKYSTKSNNNSSNNVTIGLNNNYAKDISAKMNSLTLEALENSRPRRNSTIVGEEVKGGAEEPLNNYQTYDITAETLETWFNCDSKMRRSPEGGEDNHQKDYGKTGDDFECLDSFSANGSLSSVSIVKKEKKEKKKQKELGDGNLKKCKKSKEKNREKTKSGERKKKKLVKAENEERDKDKDDEEPRYRDELEEFLNGPIGSAVDGSYEAF